MKTSTIAVADCMGDAVVTGMTAAPVSWATSPEWLATWSDALVFRWKKGLNPLPEIRRQLLIPEGLAGAREHPGRHRRPSPTAAVHQALQGDLQAKLASSGMAACAFHALRPRKPPSQAGIAVHAELVKAAGHPAPVMADCASQSCESREDSSPAALGRRLRCRAASNPLVAIRVHACHRFRPRLQPSRTPPPRKSSSDYKLMAFDMDSTLITIEVYIDEIAHATGQKGRSGRHYRSHRPRGEITDFKDSPRQRGQTGGRDQADMARACWPSACA